MLLSVTSTPFHLLESIQISAALGLGGGVRRRSSSIVCRHGRSTQTRRSPRRDHLLHPPPPPRQILHLLQIRLQITLQPHLPPIVPPRSLPPPIGFGYASLQFKVVRFFSLERYGTGENCCEVFTLGSSDGWRRTVAPPYKPDWGGPFLNGAIHLMPYKVYGERDQYADRYIAAFDVDTEKYHTVPLPEIGDVLLLPADLVVLRGLLCLAFYFETRKVLELWFLKDYDDGKWAKEYDIDFSSVDGVFLPYPVAFMGDGRILLSVYCVGGQYEHFWYNTQERCFARKQKYKNCSIRLFVETFMPLRAEIAGRPRLLLPYP